MKPHRVYDVPSSTSSPAVLPLHSHSSSHPATRARPAGFRCGASALAVPSARNSISPCAPPSHLQTSDLECFPWTLDFGPTSSLPPTPCFQRRISSLSDRLRTSLMYFVEYVSLPSSPHREFCHCHFPGAQISV